ncbi:MAG: hypothetical protein AAFY76_06180 [Cyanobacteria bacterium J06649_11]
MLVVLFLLVLNSVCSQSAESSVGEIQVTEEAIVKIVTVRFDYTRAHYDSGIFGVDSVNLSKMDFIYQQLANDINLKLKINVYHGSSFDDEGYGFVRARYGAQNLLDCFSKKDTSVLKEGFFHFMYMIDLTKEEFATAEALEKNRQVEFVLFK